MAEESEWQEKWAESGIFNPEPDQREKYLITVPWPYTSGPLHVGHGRTYTLADIVGRYKRLRGFNVLFPMGFHESGTPIGSISEKIKRGDEKTISLYRKYIAEYENEENVEAIMNSFKEPLNVANYFSSKITKDFKTLGYAIDWRRTFRSIDPVYSKFVQWQFRKLGSMNLLKQGSHQVLYSIEDGNAVGEDDIEDGDTDKVSIEKFVMVLFKKNDEDVYLAAASLRPETIFAVTNLWINPDSRYVRIRVDDKIIITSEKASQKILYQFENSELKDAVESDEILNSQYTVPATGVKVKVYRNTRINPEQATGVVYSVPGHSVMDLSYIDELGIGLEGRSIINLENKKSSASEYLAKYKDPSRANSEMYKDEFYSGVMASDLPLIGGKSVKEAREIVQNELIKRGFAYEFYETSRPARTRDGKPVIVSIMHDQWFINYSNEEWKDKVRENVSKMNFYPEFYRKNMFDVIDWIEERACARKRGLGTPFPQDGKWVIESLSDSTIYPAFYTFSHLINDKDPEDLDDNFFDYITDNGTEEVNPGMKELSQEARKEFKYWYGVDQRITSAPHMSNHLVFYLMNHMAMFKGRYQPKGISIIGTVISKGAKISKSKGNAISLLDVVKQYGADLFRLYVALVAEVDSSLDWNETEIENVKSVYGTIKNVFSLILEKGESKTDGYTELFKIKFKHHLKNYFEKMDSFQIRAAYVEIIHETLKDLNQLGNLGMDTASAVKEIWELWIQVLSCAIPHLSETIWKQMGKSGFVSISEIRAEVISEGDRIRVENFDYVLSLSEDIRAIQNVTKIKPSLIKITVGNESLKEDARKILQGDLNVSTKSIIGNVKKFRGKLNLDVNEMGAITQYKEILEKLFLAGVAVEEYAGDGNKKVPLPGRPVIDLEGEKIG